MVKTKFAPLSGQKSAPTAEQIRQLVEEEAIGGNNDTSYQNAIAKTRHAMIPRPGFGTVGQQITIPVNSFRVTKFPTKAIFQYDVVIGRAGEYGTMRVAANWKVWESKKVAKEFPQVSTFLYDGKRAAWSMTDLGDGNLLKVADINLDEEQGRQPRTKPDILDLRIIKAKKVNIGLLQTYMDGKMSWDVPILEAINFFNHLMRSTPAKQYINFGGSYFRREISEQRDIAVLGPYNEAYKGVYQSIRPAQGGKLIVNVDVSNGTFWRPDLMVNHAVHLLRLSSLSELVGHLLGNDINRQRDPAAWQKAVTARKKAATDMLSRRLRGLLFTSTCQTEGPKRKYKVAEIRFPNAQEQKIKVKVNGDSGMMTVEQFYKKKFPNSHFRNPTLPLVRTHKADVVFPLEFCLIERDQRFMHKLTPDQTANMIRFAVTDGHDRAHRVKLGTQMLNWKDDPWLKQYQLSVEQEMINTKARVLPAPQVNYDPASKNRNNQPERRLVVSNGKWNLQGKKFYKKGQLDSWGILILTKYALLRHKKNQLPDDPGDSRNYTSPELAKSINGFVQQLANCGVRLGPNAKSPVTYGFNGNNPSQSMHKLWEACLARFKTPPQLLCFVCVDKGVEPYSTIKKYCDTVLGCVSQGMNNMNFGKASPQYFANVAMKVNAKLGGFSCFAGPTDAKGNPTNEYGLSSKPIMYIGADVSHAPRQFVNQGIMRNPSLAAVTCSMDKLGCAYSAKCFTQPGGLELMDKTKLQPTFRELFGHYGRATKKTPEVIVYIRDGVSEGQYGYVLTEEVKAMEEELLKSERIQAMKVKPKWTVVVAGKRHHTRFLPGRAGDENGNARPGTIVERDITMPYEFDWYQVSHVALKGCAKPVHYVVLRDDSKHTADQLQTMIYNHSYQYVRSTTGISLHPAAQYAHLASNRSRLSHCGDALEREVSDGEPTKKTTPTEAVTTEGTKPVEVREVDDDRSKPKTPRREGMEVPVQDILPLQRHNDHTDRKPLGYEFIQTMWYI